MTSSLAEILFKEQRRRVLGLLLLHPEQGYHVREIARLTGTVAGSVNRELMRLAGAGLLLKQNQGNQVVYTANAACPIYQELASILRKTSGIADVLAGALASLAEKIDRAFIFGSVAKGSETAGSDIDLLVVGSLEFAELVQHLYPAQTTLQREINPKLYSPAEWQRLCKQGDPFIIAILQGKTIHVAGASDDIG